MVPDGDKPAVTAVESAVNVTLRLSQIIYDLKAVDEQTRDLLECTKHISANLQQARLLRHQKSQQLNCSEQNWIDGVLRDTDRCLRDVAALIEPARVDLQTRSAIGLLNRGRWVFRDSPKIATNLSKLQCTNQSLNFAMTVLCTKVAPPIESTPSETSSVAKSTTSHIVEVMSGVASPPPSYNESEVVIRRRARRLSSWMTLEDRASKHESSGMQKSASTFTLLPPLVSRPDFYENVIDELEATQVSPKSSTTVTTPTISVTQEDPNSISFSTEPELPSLNTFEGSDGLQVVDDCFDGLQVVMYQPYSPLSRPSSIITSDRYRRHSDTVHENHQSPEVLEVSRLHRKSETLAPARPLSSCSPPLPPRPPHLRSQTSTSYLCVEPEQGENLDVYDTIPMSLRPGRPAQSRYSQAVPPSKDISSIPLPMSELPIKNSGSQNTRPDDLQRCKSSETKVAGTRVKSRGRAWLESQSGL